MAVGRTYYWLKLRESFMTSDAVDFLMGQKDGANYVVLYQMLCLKTINTDGRLSRRIGEVLIPYDEAKIARDCKWFSTDTIRVALNLYKALGLIYEDTDGVLVMAKHNEMVGKETDYAEQKRLQRANQKELPTSVDSSVDIVHTEIRDKSIEYRYKSIDIEEEKTFSNEKVCRADAQRAVDAWNNLPTVKNVTRIISTSSRYKMLMARIKDYGIDEVLRAIENIRNSPHLLGNNRSGWQITFDWFVRPNNFPKVLDGNYINDNSRNAKESSIPKWQMSIGDIEKSEETY